MDRPQKTETELSPLDQIRLAEAEVTRRIAAAREDAKQIVREAKIQATHIKNQAYQAGHSEGQTRNMEIVSKAEEEAQTLITHAHHQAEALRRKGQRDIANAISHAINIVIGLEGGAEDK